MVKRYEERSSTANNRRKGRPRKLNERMERKIKIAALKNTAVSAGALANMVESTYGMSVSSRTVRNVVNSQGIYGRIKKTLY